MISTVGEIRLRDLPLRVAVYARVSSEEQRQGHTIDSQVTELERYAEKKGWSITQIYSDDGWSGATLARPAIDQLRDDAEKGLFDVALFNDVDRLSRNVYYLGIIKRDLERKKIRIAFKKLPGEEGPIYNLMINILASFAEFEREIIIDRTRRGRRYKVETRHLFIGCTPPYGLRYIVKSKKCKDGRLELIPSEVGIIKQIFEWADDEDLSAYKIKCRLNERKIRARISKQWNLSSINRILRNETYTGVWHFNKRKTCEPTYPDQAGKYRRKPKQSHRTRPREEWIMLELPKEFCIVDRDRWERVQKALTSRFKAHDIRNHHSLLTGRLRCGACCSQIIGVFERGRSIYRCLGGCKSFRRIPAEQIDEAVLAALETTCLQQDLIADQLALLHNWLIPDNDNNSELQTGQTATFIQKTELHLIWQSLFESWRAISPSLTGLERRELWRQIIQSVELLDGQVKVVGVLPFVEILSCLPFNISIKRPFNNSPFELTHPVRPRSHYRDRLIVKREEDLGRRNLIIQFLFKKGITATQLERMNVTDLQMDTENVVVSAHEAYRTPAIKLSLPTNLVNVLKEYLATRSQPIIDSSGEPLFISTGPRQNGRRLNSLNIARSARRHY